MLVTSVGREEEYREKLIEALDSDTAKYDNNTPIDRLENLLEMQRKRQKNGK